MGQPATTALLVLSARGQAKLLAPIVLLERTACRGVRHLAVAACAQVERIQLPEVAQAQPAHRVQQDLTTPITVEQHVSSVQQDLSVKAGKHPAQIVQLAHTAFKDVQHQAEVGHVKPEVFLRQELERQQRAVRVLRGRTA